VKLRPSLRSLQLSALLFDAFLLSLVGLGVHAQAPKPSAGFRIVLTGDSIVNRRFSVYDDPASAGLFQIIRSGDAAFTNFETLITNYAYPGAAQSGGAYQSSPAFVTDELKWAGFNLLSVANNHAFDFGEGGMRSTLRALDQAGLVHAGAGENLALARDPAFLETKHGRVALIAVASTFTDGSLAGEQRPDVVGRPGVDPLRFTTTYTVDQDSFQALEKIASSVGGGGGGEEGDGGEAASRGQGARTRVRLGALQFQLGDTPSVHTQPNKSDLDGLVASVRNAHRQAGWVIVSSHTHESGHGGQSIPPDFLVTAAHAAIDAGADVFVAHGPHILRGIEIYKGKPIFYSLGNFIFENETMLYQPAESYDSLGLPWDAAAADYFDARSKNDTRGFPAEKAVWESVVAEVSFNDDHTLKGISLTPISLGFQEPRSERGRPRLSSPDQGKSIIDNVAKISAPFRTTVTFNAGRGTVQAEAKQQ
jgi:poly-gamma-glutamate capsule biosynthesis protein CapA/YwtB (metallophosphatase superfamily)